MEGTVEKTDSKRMAISRRYLNDARHKQLSSSTRLRCAWEAMYFCCCEFAVGIGRCIDGLEHPDEDVVKQLLRVLSMSSVERTLVEALFRWASYQQSIFPEPCSPEEACSLAERVYAQTVALLAAMQTRTK
jgi:hypothetical protein